MTEKTNKSHQFNIPKRKNNQAVILLSFMLVCIIAITLAYYFASDFATKTVVMTGKVDIEAVGSGPSYSSIENRNPNSNLFVSIPSPYNNVNGKGVLIPGMPISLDANCKVYASTTKPLLRAKFEIQIYDNDTLLTSQQATYTGSSGDVSLYDSFTTMLDNVITAGSDWLYYSTDGYYYYIGSHTPNATLGNTELWEVDVTSGDQVVSFIDSSITFPTGIEADFSTFRVKFIITFEAIQNFIPNASGVQLPNTIINAKTIFDDNREGGQDYGGTNTNS